MFKKLFSLLLLCILTCSIKSKEQEINNAIEPMGQAVENEQAEKTISFEVKQSAVFEDFSKTLSAEAKAELESFIKQIEATITETKEFIELAKQYQDLFNDLKVKKEGLIKVTLVFAFERENWTELVKHSEMDFNALKNNFSEKKLAELSNNLAMLETSLNKNWTSLLVNSEYGKLQRALREKSFNQMIRLGLVLS